MTGLTCQWLGRFVPARSAEQAATEKNFKMEGANAELGKQIVRGTLVCTLCELPTVPSTPRAVHIQLLSLVV